MKQFRLFTVLVLMSSVAFSQSYPGYRSGNYTGVNGVFFNPGSIADSRYRWDVNLISIHAGLGNSNLSFKLKNIGDAFGDNADSLLLGSGNKPTNGMVNLDVFGPSVMFNTSAKTSFAITTRFRTMANVANIDGSITDAIDNEGTSFPLVLNSNANQKITVNGWTDIGASMATVLLNNGKHFIKGGLTLKYLAGTANTYANINKLKGTINEDIAGDVYLTNGSGSVAIGYAGIDIDNFEASDAFKFNGSGFGGDLGFVYEYRPDGEKTARSENKYKFKVGIALLDIGSIKYKPKSTDFGNYTINISPAQRWYPSDLDDKSIAEIKTYLDGSPYFTNNSSSSTSYKVKLPTNLQMNVDWAINRAFFVDLSGQLNLADKEDIYTSFYNNSVTLTPRYEARAFGFYLPLNYNELTKFNAGVSLRMGPLFLGSGSVLTALLDKSKQADVHFGIRFGNLQKKTRKVKDATLKAEEIPVQVAEVKQAIADSDADGIIDTEDKCPTVAGLAKYNGCPVPDTDGDGVNDELDKCVTVAGFAKYGGCPIPDTDKDGINDELDACPTVTGVEKYKGCPIPDTDGDGVNDDDDKCPSLAGVASNKGCPEIKEEVKKKVNIAAKNILFASGSSKLLAGSNKGLNDVAKIMQENSDLKISIDGHTDNTGKADKNQLLSETRANAVKQYFIAKGIDESRITATGYGQNEPVADNKTAAGRVQNRRVVLTLAY